MTNQSQPLKIQPEAKFSLGRVVATPGACKALDRHDTSYSSLVDRHVAGDWGDICAFDARANEQALLDNTRLLSCYTLGDERIWVITEHDRTSTCILLPCEY